MQIKTHFSAGNTRSVFSEQINIDKKIHISAFVSAGFLFVFSAMAVFPVVNSFSGAEAAAVISETTLAMTTSDINLPLSVTDLNGSFVAGDPADFTVTTNNYSGYTLSISAKTDDENYSKLVNGNDVFNSISSATDATGFNNGNWGYMPSKLNSSANTSYQPAPTFAGDTLDVTAAANNEANTYSIALGAKADYSLPAGKYSNTFVITAIANPVGYAISYSANTDDQTVAGIPSAQVGDTTTTSVELSSDSPTRTGYEFNDWCDGTVTATMGVDSCMGTVYAPGDTYDMNQTGANVLTLKAMWNRKYTISFDANTGTGTMPDQVITGSFALLDENTFTKTDYDFDGWNTAADGNGTSYTDMDNFNVPATGTGETLYAQWKRSTVTFEQSYSNAGKSKVLNTKDNKEYYTLQDMNASICSAVSTSMETDYSDTQQIQVMDTRDEKVYWIAKLLDGHCWMTQNLDHDIVTTAGYYTHDNTDLGWGSDKTTTSWTPTRATIPTADISNTGSISGWTNDLNNNTPYSVDTGDWYWTDTWYWTNNSNIYNYLAGNVGDPAKFATSPYAGNGTHGHVGNIYNWSAAVASNDTSSYTTNTSSDISNNPQNSICPAGWRLPTKSNQGNVDGSTSEFERLNGLYGNEKWTDKYITANPLYFVRGGDVYSGSLYDPGHRGYYWSSTVDVNNGAYYLNFGAGVVDPTLNGNRNFGRSLRCIARNNEEPGTFNYAFASASKTKATANDGKQYYKMQDMTSSICGAITTGQTSQLVDTRDGAVYHVGKLADNRCWSLDNLALDLTASSASTNITAANTNADATSLNALFGVATRDASTDPDGNLATVGVADWTSGSSYSAPLVNMASKDMTRADLANPGDPLTEADDWKFGGYYNFCAASAGSYCYGDGTSSGSPSGDASSDICPSGWRMPTGGASGEYRAVYNEFSGTSRDDDLRKALRLPLSGGFADGAPSEQGSIGVFWSSTYSSYSSGDMPLPGIYFLLVGTYGTDMTSGVVRDAGNSVRCVAQ